MRPRSERRLAMSGTCAMRKRIGVLLRPQFALAILALVTWLLVPAVGRAYLTDLETRWPPDYTTFRPPAGEGGAYVDPVFGTTVKRLSVPVQYLSPYTKQHTQSVCNA